MSESETPGCPYCPGAIPKMVGPHGWCLKCGCFLEHFGGVTFVAWKHEGHPEYLARLKTPPSGGGGG